MIVSLCTARAGSVGVPGKNEATIGGAPMYLHGIEACYGVDRIDAHYMATDIDVPSSDVLTVLAMKDDDHIRLIQNAVRVIEAREDGPVGAVVLTFGNVTGAQPHEIEAAIAVLDLLHDVDSVVAVAKRTGYCPHKAMVSDQDGTLRPHPHAIVPTEHANHRGDDTLFMSGQWFVIRRRAIFDTASSPFPFAVMGCKAVAFEVDAAHLEVDDPWQLELMRMYSGGGG